MYIYIHIVNNVSYHRPAGRLRAWIKKVVQFYWDVIIYWLNFIGIRYWVKWCDAGRRAAGASKERLLNINATLLSAAARAARAVPSALLSQSYISITYYSGDTGHSDHYSPVADTVSPLLVCLSLLVLLTSCKGFIR